jgi:HEAT repeat protein
MTEDLGELLAELTSGDDSRAEAAAQLLASLATSDPRPTLSALQELLEQPAADQRWWALRALSEVRHPDVVGLLLGGLQDTDLTVRQCAALGLRLHPEPQAIPALLETLQAGDALLANLAGAALAACGAPAIDGLSEILHSASPAARVRAARSLASLGDERAIPALFAALDEDSALIEYWASEGLERLGVGMIFFKPG